MLHWRKPQTFFNMKTRRQTERGGGKPSNTKMSKPPRGRLEVSNDLESNRVICQTLTLNNILVGSWLLFGETLPNCTDVTLYYLEFAWYGFFKKAHTSIFGLKLLRCNLFILWLNKHLVFPTEPELWQSGKMHLVRGILKHWNGTKITTTIYS